jgi:hypothetical protein
LHIDSAELLHQHAGRVTRHLHLRTE